MGGSSPRSPGRWRRPATSACPTARSSCSRFCGAHDRVRLRILLVDSPGKHLALDHVVLRRRNELFSALDEAAQEFARAVGEEPPQSSWPTRDVEAYVAYLEADMSAAHEMGVRVADPRRSFDSTSRPRGATRASPTRRTGCWRSRSTSRSAAAVPSPPRATPARSCSRSDPSAFKAHLAMAEIDLAQGDARAAERRISAALALQPEWVPAFERMGTALSRQGRHGEAIAWFEKAILERADDTDALQGLAVALAECGQLERAVERWQEALARGVRTVDLHENLARAFSALGRRAQARSHRALSRRLSGSRRFGLICCAKRGNGCQVDPVQGAEETLLPPSPPGPGTLGALRPPLFNIFLFLLTFASAFIAGSALKDTQLPDPTGRR